MLSQLVASHRQEILERTERAMARRFPSHPPGIDQIPRFLDGVALALERSSEREGAARAAVHAAAVAEAQARKDHGFSIEVVARSFGSVCEAITSIAVERGIELDARDMQLLNLCIDDAIADGILNYAMLSERAAANVAALRAGFLAHEMRNAINGAMVAFEVLREGRVGILGRTGDVLDRCLRRLNTLIAQELSAARLEAGAPLQRERLYVARVVHEIVMALPPRPEVAVTLELDEDVTIDADRDLFASAVGNLVQNAIKHTRPGGEVRVRTLRESAAVRVEVEDACGGLGTDHPEALFQAFRRGGSATAGAGLGLAIARQSVESHGGTASVHDLPGKGCVFSLAWPRSGSG